MCLEIRLSLTGLSHVDGIKCYSSPTFSKAAEPLFATNLGTDSWFSWHPIYVRMYNRYLSLNHFIYKHGDSVSSPLKPASASSPMRPKQHTVQACYLYLPPSTTSQHDSLSNMRSVTRNQSFTDNARPAPRVNLQNFTWQPTLAFRF